MSKPWDWTKVNNKKIWLEPDAQCYLYAAKWAKEGKKDILDLGCGLGRHSIYFAKSNFNVTATDLSKDAIEYLDKYKHEENLEINTVIADMLSLPFEDNSFDAVFAFHSISHTDSKGIKEILSEIRRVLRPDGAVFLTMCSKDTWSFTNAHPPYILDNNTIIKESGLETGIPHFYVDEDDIKELFKDFMLVDIKYVSHRYFDNDWQDTKHYYIEIKNKKE